MGTLCHAFRRKMNEIEKRCQQGEDDRATRKTQDRTEQSVHAPQEPVLWPKKSPQPTAQDHKNKECKNKANDRPRPRGTDMDECADSCCEGGGKNNSNNEHQNRNDHRNSARPPTAIGRNGEKDEQNNIQRHDPASASLTTSCTTLPSAWPFISFIATGITLFASCGPAAPVSRMISRIRAIISSRESCFGR